MINFGLITKENRKEHNANCRKFLIIVTDC